MKCELCQKNISTIHIQEIVNNRKREFHICEQCACKNGILKSTGNSNQLNFTISNLIKKLLGAKPKNTKQQNKTVKVCSNCQTSSTEIEETNCVGCPECYNDLYPYINEKIMHLHGTDKHIEKKKKKKLTIIKHERDIIKLKQKMEYAIRFEKYEDAAYIRDNIRCIEKQIKELKR